jgi:hypothetical protein
VGVLLQLAGQDLGFLVGQRDRAGVNAAVLEDPLLRVAADLAVVALHLHVVQCVGRQDRDVVLVGKPPAGGDFKVVKHEVIIRQILAEPLDRPGLAVVFWRADSMNDRHVWDFLMRWRRGKPRTSHEPNNCASESDPSGRGGRLFLTLTANFCCQAGVSNNSGADSQGHAQHVKSRPIYEPEESATTRSIVAVDLGKYKSVAWPKTPAMVSSAALL